MGEIQKQTDQRIDDQFGQAASRPTTDSFFQGSPAKRVLLTLVTLCLAWLQWRWFGHGNGTKRFVKREVQTHLRGNAHHCWDQTGIKTCKNKQTHCENLIYYVVIHIQAESVRQSCHKVRSIKVLALPFTPVVRYV